MARRQICGVVLLRSDRAALLQLRDDKPEITDPGLWVFPGGHCEPGESYPACAIREFLEETEYRCADLQPLVVFSGGEIGYADDFDLRFYWTRFDNRQGIRCHEGQDLRFIRREEADELLAPGYLVRVWDMALAAAQFPAEAANELQ